MSKLVTTQPAAFDAFFGLLQAAGAAQNPAVQVFDSELLQYEPGSYVMLTGFDNHHYDWAALGQFPFYETYDLIGMVTVFQGNVDQKTIRDSTFSVYQDVVQTTVVNNSGSWASQNGSVLSPALQSAGLMWIIPSYARYTSEPGNVAGGQAGFLGVIEFAYSLKARITAV